MSRITVRVNARDPISEAGVASALRPRPEVRVVGRDEDEPPEVVVVIADAVDEETLTTLRFVRRNGESRVILSRRISSDQDLVSGRDGRGRSRAASGGASDRLVAVITAAAAGEGTVPPDLLGRLLDEVGRLQRTVLDPRGSRSDGLGRTRDRGAQARRRGGTPPHRD